MNGINGYRNYDTQLSKASKTLLGSETDMIDKLYVSYGLSSFKYVWCFV